MCKSHFEKNNSVQNMFLLFFEVFVFADVRCVHQSQKLLKTLRALWNTIQNHQKQRLQKNDLWLTAGLLVTRVFWSVCFWWFLTIDMIEVFGVFWSFCFCWFWYFLQKNKTIWKKKTILNINKKRKKKLTCDQRRAVSHKRFWDFLMFCGYVFVVFFCDGYWKYVFDGFWNCCFDVIWWFLENVFFCCDLLAKIFAVFADFWCSFDIMLADLFATSIWDFLTASWLHVSICFNWFRPYLNVTQLFWGAMAESMEEITDSPHGPEITESSVLCLQFSSWLETQLGKYTALHSFKKYINQNHERHWRSLARSEKQMFQIFFKTFPGVGNCHSRIGQRRFKKKCHCFLTRCQRNWMPKKHQKT